MPGGGRGGVALEARKTISGRTMKKILFGIIVGIAVVVVFIFYGGGDYLKKFGWHAEKAGSKIEKMEKKLKGSVSGVKEKVEKTADKVKDYVP